MEKSWDTWELNHRNMCSPQERRTQILKQQEQQANKQNRYQHEQGKTKEEEQGKEEEEEIKLKLN